MPEELSAAVSWEGYNLGNPISSNPGVNCYPAIGGDGKRYIVKSISVPASQTQLDALLLTGAFTQSSDAVDYFRQKTEQIAREAELLSRLSKLEGFVGYKSWKISPLEAENRLGYQIRMVGPFKRSLERCLRTDALTHLETVNLGLDLCAALACCRRTGYLYINLKPTNVYITAEREYKIGDLGFAALDALSFSSLPLTCASPYSAPELRDGMKTINETADTYGVGMILYRILNNGKLPPRNRDWSTPLPMPANADEEIGEIILKACAPDPADRWENPTVMGQALVAYMQRNAINDVPVTVPVVNRQTGKLPKFTGRLPQTTAQTMVFKASAKDESAEEKSVQPETVEKPAAPELPEAEPEAPRIPEAEPQAAQTPSAEPEKAAPTADEIPAEEPAVQEVPEETARKTEAEEALAEPEKSEAPKDETPETEEPKPEGSEEKEHQAEKTQAEESHTEKPQTEEPQAEESRPEEAETAAVQAESTAAENDETVKVWEPSRDKEPVQQPAQEVSPNQDAVPAQEPVKPPVQKESVEPTAEIPVKTEPVQIPAPAVSAQMPVPAPMAAPAAPEQDALDDPELKSLLDTPRQTFNMPVKPKHYDPGRMEFEEKPKRSFKFLKVLVTLIVVGLLLAGLALGGLWAYRSYYVQVIDSLEVAGSPEGITVTVITQGDMSKIEVSCADAYGNGQTKPLGNGQVEFTDLKAGSLYNIKVISSGHKLEGETYTIYTTDSEAKVVSLSAVTGTESGSMVLSLTVDGAEPEKWLVVCTADGAEDISEAFTGHVVTVRGLTPGKDYTVTLSAEDGSAVTGQTTLEFSAKNLVLAQNINLENTPEGDLLVSWDPPMEAVGSWKVRCYNDTYDEETTVWSTEAVFTGIASAQSYTVEITAEGMTQSARAVISANPITVKDFKAEVQDEKLVLSWSHEGRNPDGGWLVNYTVDGGSAATMASPKDGGEISFAISGSKYDFTIQAADETSIFENVYSYQVPEAPAYKGHTIILSKVNISTLKTPEQQGWLVENVDKDAFKDTFAPSEKISLALKANCKFFLEDEDITVRYVFRDADGKALPSLITTQESDWNTIWYDGNYQNGELNLPLTPSQSGLYTLEVYFNGALFGTTQFTIT